jgi:superfamily II DNA or RNA helicase/HKD family nuclease
LNNAEFISNESSRTLKKRLEELISASQELKFLVGFFYFSGIRELVDSLKTSPELSMKVLVGLEADASLGTLVEYGLGAPESDAEGAGRFFNSVKAAVNTAEFDTAQFQEQVRFFLEMIRDERLVIRKTRDPSHAKLYIFKLKEEHKLLREKLFITGSSNLTRAGLVDQQEFNVEIGDYGSDEAEVFFDSLWLDAVCITEQPEFKTKLLKLFEEETLVAEITPFEAYALILKTYADLQHEKELEPSAIELLKAKGYTPYAYQLDAVRQALSILDVHNGVIVADVVGLGKSVIASLIAKSLKKRGVIICPPGLVGDKNNESGWRKYVNDFKLERWEVRSCGELESIADFARNQGHDCEVVILDEAHRFRNQDSRHYELLSRICRNRQVILLTATPFNNTPGDIFSLLKLFTVPGKSTLTLTDDLDGRFTEYRNTFRRLSTIRKNWNARDPKKRARAEGHYRILFDEPEIDLALVEHRIRRLSRQIRSVIEPVTIRRNRLDLRNDPEYSREINELPEVRAPQEQLFVLTPAQSAFYDRVINDYFGEEGRFTGAIYQPYLYESGMRDEEQLDAEGNRQFQSQRNLYEFMRRLLVKRFESSFGAFEKSVGSFLRTARKAQQFIETSGKYILDRDLLENLFEKDEDEIDRELEAFEQKLDAEKSERTRRDQVYVLSEFADGEQFKADIQSDIDLLKEIQQEIKELKLTANDPKTAELIKALKEILHAKPKSGEPRRKVIVFSEYVHTVRYLQPALEVAFDGRVFTVPGELGVHKEKEMLHNFDAFAPAGKQADDYDILLASDKISEGFNLNRAGAIVNYDIPWNPTRVIQRVGRINRIGKKVFDELCIYNFFPTEQGADVVKSRQIAADKMFMIHRTLGEDAQIFSVDEKPTASALYSRVSRAPEEQGGESSFTEIRRRLKEIEEKHPEVLAKIEKFAPRIKTAKAAAADSLVVFTKKGRDLFAQARRDGDQEEIAELGIEEAIDLIRCGFDEPRIPFSVTFWENYITVRDHREKHQHAASEISIEKKALNVVNACKGPEFADLHPFILTLREDMLDYRTLPANTLRRIAAIGTNKEKAKKEFAALRTELGDDYLRRLKQRIQELREEVIIAVENLGVRGG